MTEPGFDPRVYQANERTLLAWVRTGLGLMAFGFVVARAGVWLRYIAGERAPSSDSRFAWLGIAFVLLGTVFSVLSAVEYTRVRHAIASGRPVPTGRLATVLTVLVALLGVAMVVMLATGSG